MSIRSEFIGQIEAYFSGEMKGVDRLVFEGKIESDPVFKAEFENQKNIVESLKAHRAAELKARLSNISVEPTLIGALFQSSIVKPVLYGLTSLSVITGSYMFYNTESATNFQIHSVEGKKDYFTASHINPEFQDEINFEYTRKEELVYENPKPLQSITAKISKEVIPSNKQNPAFEVPDMGVDIEDDFRSPGIELETTQRVEHLAAISTPGKISINQVNSRKYNFHYRIEDNRLYLYGKFNDSPYEILEVNTPSDKKIYFYYNGEFFHLRKGASDVTRLSSIEDQELIEKLNSLKTNYNN